MEIKKLKQFQLDQLYKPYEKCMQCPLGSLGRTRVVFGEGNPDANLMLIGEAPGKNEDLQGKPFIGRSGKLLNSALERAGISREQTFITNIVKCRPPNNRTPRPQEIRTCKSLLLLGQIKIIQPSIICTLGSAATQGLLGQKVKITQARGIKHLFQGITIIPTYHPAYTLRNPKKIADLIADITAALSNL